MKTPWWLNFDYGEFLMNSNDSIKFYTKMKKWGITSRICSLSIESLWTQK